MEFIVSSGAWNIMREAACAVRFAVFVREQGVPQEIELDEWDAVSVHAIASSTQGEVLGTGRLLPDGHIGRMAVLARARGLGVGTALLKALIDAARQHDMPELLLNAQTQAVPFYRRFGFETEGDVFMEAGIAHLRMRRRLERAF